MNSLLVELHTEELPPKALKALAEAFAAGLEKGLRERNFLTADSRATAYATPRRLAAHINHVRPASPDEPSACCGSDSTTFDIEAPAGA